MNDKFVSYRRKLEATIERLGRDVAAIEEATLVAVGGQANGELSNAPLHLADSGTDAFNQELNSVLLENEQFLYYEALAAVQRLNEGTYGRCEACGTAISDSRLDAIPYTRHCLSCAEKLESGPELNVNSGRPNDETETIAAAEKMVVHNESSLDQVAFGRDDQDELIDRHAAGTPGGGTSLGGLAGTNVGRGDPAAVDLEDAMGSGLMDDDRNEEDVTTPQSSREGSAVGGTPASKRSGDKPKSTRRPQKG